MAKKARVTMADVARVANVTPQTVSRAFRNTPDISEETRLRVLKVAEELNYVMNNTASSLHYGSSRQIVIVYDNLKNIYFPIMIDYLQTALRERGYSILVHSIAEPTLSRSSYEFAISNNAAGVISFLEPTEEIERLIEHFGLPVLILGRRTSLNNVDYLCADDEEGGRLAARYLIERGARRLGFFTVDLSVSCAQDRLAGFSEEAKKAGLEAPVAVDAYANPLEQSLKELYGNERTAPDGIFCFNDMLAFDVLYYFEQNGIPLVPIVGYDCIQQEIHIPNRITSVGPDKKSLASSAADMIIAKIEGDGKKKKSVAAEVFLVSGQRDR